MHFTIITPSFNQLDYLKRCVASVADQVAEGFSVHHHVQDGASTDGTVEWLRAYDERVSGRGAEDEKSNTNCLKPTCTLPGYTFSYESVSDEGMYDAINRGIELTLDHQKSEVNGQHSVDGGTSNSKLQTFAPPDSVVAWLNCDEQYLQGTLPQVAENFAAHSGVDLLFGGMLMVDEAGELLACRKAMPMRKWFLEASYLYNYSCAMFFREPLWRRLGGFDSSFKNVGDEELIRRVMGLGVRSRVIDEYLSTFMYGKKNLSSDPASVLEHERLKNQMGKSTRVLVNLARLVEKGVRGGLVQRDPVVYTIYVGEGADRSLFQSIHPTCRWPGEAKPYLVKHRLER